MKLLVLTFLFLWCVSLVAKASSDTWPSEQQLRIFSEHDKADQSNLPWAVLTLKNISVYEILPRKFRFGEGDQVQGIVDSLTVRLFQSATARKSLCFLTLGNPDEIRVFLGVSLKGARQLKEECRVERMGRTHQKAFKEIHGLYRLPGADRSWAKNITQHFQRPPEPKKYLFFFSEDPSTSPSAYTSDGNYTNFIFPSKGLKTAEMIRMMAHELAITFDQLVSLAPPHVDPQEAWEGTTVARMFGGHERRSAFATVKDSQDLMCALRDPALRYAAAIERASRFEDYVIQDLGLLRESPQVSSGQGCRSSLLKWSFYQLTFHKATDSNLIMINGACGDSSLNPNRFETFWNRLRLIESTSLKVLANGKKVSLCDFWTQPRLGMALPDVTPGGPRPRIGGWKYTSPNLGEWTPQELEDGLREWDGQHRLDPLLVDRLEGTLQMNSTFGDGKFDLNKLMNDKSLRLQLDQLQ